MHELTEKCLDWHKSSEPVEPLETIITTWLEQKAKEIEKSQWSKGTETTRQILGLEKPKPEWCEHHYESDCHGIDMIKFSSGMEMCAGGTKHPDRWNYCPICGAKRSE